MRTTLRQHGMTQPVRADRAGRSGGAAGFTLMELLVVVSIIAILMTLVVSVGSAVRAAGKEDETRGTLLTIRTALNAYHDASGTYPADAGPFDSNKGTLDNWVAYNSSMLNQQLQSVGTSQAKLKALPPSATGAGAKDYVYDSKTQNFPVLLDAFGVPLLYQHAEGAGQTPLVMSAGKDKTWNDGDDIRSDNR